MTLIQQIITVGMVVLATIREYPKVCVNLQTDVR